MTKEETKRHFQSWCQRTIGNNCSNEDYAMFNNIMALLDQETCDDCVSRKQALSAISNLYPSEPFLRRNWQKWQQENKKYFECEHIIKALPPVITTHKAGRWEYKQLGLREYGVVCTSCGFTVHHGYDFNSMEEFKDMIEKNITTDKYCRKCGAETRGDNNEY